MTWKQLRYLVEAKLDSNSIDVNAQPIHIRLCDVRHEHKNIQIEVSTVDMPKRCSVLILGRR